MVKCAVWDGSPPASTVAMKVEATLVLVLCIFGFISSEVLLVTIGKVDRVINPSGTSVRFVFLDAKGEVVFDAVRFLEAGL